jgi:hypothetical protein
VAMQTGRRSLDLSARLLLACLLYPVGFAGANGVSRPAPPGAEAGLRLLPATLGPSVGSAAFLPFRPGFRGQRRSYATPDPKRKSTTVAASGTRLGPHATVSSMGSSPVAADALLDLLMPLWQLVIGLLVLVALVVSVHRLVRRGPSRMGGAMLIAGGAVVCVAVLSYLYQAF